MPKTSQPCDVDFKPGGGRVPGTAEPQTMDARHWSLGQAGPGSVREPEQTALESGCRLGHLRL